MKLDAIEAERRAAMTDGQESATYAAPDTRPRLASYGFTVGIMRIEWSYDPGFIITGRDGMMYTASVIQIENHRAMLKMDDACAALINVIVHHPIDGSIMRIKGVERFCVTKISTGTAGRIGLLLVPVDES